MSLPFESTKVPAFQSMAEIQGMLAAVGFEGTAQKTLNGVHTVYGMYKTVQFQFEVDVQRIVTAFVNQLGRQTQAKIRRGDPAGKAKMEDLQGQALRVGWRLLALHVKGVCDAIKLGVLTPAQAFAGHALIPGPDNKPITLAETLATAIEEGHVRTSTVLLLPEAK